MKHLVFAFSMICTICAAMLLSACGFAHNEHLIGPYRLIAIDVREQMAISYSLADGNTIARINETVFAYGWDDRYIVAKQHPNNNRAVTNFYYLEMAKDSENADPKASVVGPISEAEFALKQTELKLPAITRKIKSLE